MTLSGPQASVPLGAQGVATALVSGTFGVPGNAEEPGLFLRWSQVAIHLLHCQSLLEMYIVFS